MKIKALALATLMGASAALAQDELKPITKIEVMDLYSMNAAKYMGIKFIYNNLINYNPANAPMQPPFPYSDGRVRDGKYKASQTAMDNYMKEFAPKYNGKIFTIVKFVQGEMGLPAMVIACENGDTLYYASASVASGEFISKDFLDSEKKKKGTNFFYKNDSYNQSYINQYKTQPIMFRGVAFKNLATKQNEYFFPAMSEWKILDVTYDGEYIGEHSVMNDGMNANLSRIKYTIENKVYGKYEAYLQDQYVERNIIQNLNEEKYLSSFMGGIESNYSAEDLKHINEWAAKGDIASIYLLEKIAEFNNRSNGNNNDKTISPKIIECAKKGYIYAVYDAASASEISAEDKFKFIETAKKKYGNSKAFDELNERIASGVFSIIYEVNKTNDIKEQIAIYERMIKDLTFLDKKGITTFRYYNQPKNVKNEIDNAQNSIDKLKKEQFKQGEIEILEKERDEKKKEFEKLQKERVDLNDQMKAIIEKYNDRKAVEAQINKLREKDEQIQKSMRDIQSEIRDLEKDIRNEKSRR